MSDERQSARSAGGATGVWATLRKGVNRLQDWFVVQRFWVKVTVLVVALLIPASAFYAIALLQKQADLDQAVERMSPAGTDAWSYDESVPVVFGTGSLLGFLEANPVDRIIVIYTPITWEASERIVLVESQGRIHAYHPSEMEAGILADKAVTAPWSSKLAFVPRASLDEGSQVLLERLDQRFAAARPRSARDSWVAAFSAALSAVLTVGLLAFLFYQLKMQYKSLRFIEPSQVQGSLDDLVGMDDIKGEVAQLMDHYQRRAAYAEYGIDKPFNVMFSGPAGTGKTKLASYLARELRLPILFHSAANLETGFVAGGSNTLNRIVAMAQRRKRCIIFLDEAQDLFMKRGGRRKFDDDTANTLLSILDGVRTRHSGEIIWIVASNFSSENMQMDPAMLRRFQMKVDFRLPNREERLGILKHYLARRADKVVPELDLRHAVEVTEGRSPADLETIVNQAGISAVRAGTMIDTRTLMQAAERVLVGNVNENTTKERERDRRIIAVHEIGHFLVDLERERRLANDDWDRILADMKTIKISLKAIPRSNALGFVFHKQGVNLLKSKADIEHEVRVLLGGMANEELFFGEEGMTNGAHNDITRVTQLLHHAVGEIGMYRKTRLNFGALNRTDASADVLDEETRAIMETQSERLYAETRALLERHRALTEHLVGRLMAAGEIGLKDALDEVRGFEAAHGGTRATV